MFKQCGSHFNKCAYNLFLLDAIHIVNWTGKLSYAVIYKESRLNGNPMLNRLVLDFRQLQVAMAARTE
jgi:hypothetical protein